MTPYTAPGAYPDQRNPRFWIIPAITSVIGVLAIPVYLFLALGAIMVDPVCRGEEFCDTAINMAFYASMAAAVAAPCLGVGCWLWPRTRRYDQARYWHGAAFTAMLVIVGLTNGLPSLI